MTLFRLNPFFDTDDGGGGTPPASAPNSGEGAAKSFSQEELNQLLADEKAKWEQDAAAKIEAAKSEAEKLAKMTADEKAQFELDKRIKELEDKEQSIALRELKAETLKTLSEKGLPADVLDLVLADNAENTLKKVETFKATFDKAVQAAVDERLKGKSPNLGTGTSIEEQAREQFANALKGAR